MDSARLRLDGARWRQLDRSPMTQRDQVIAMLREVGLEREAQEVFVVVPMKDDLSTPGPIEIGRGTYHRVEVSVPAVFAAVLLAGCDRFVVAHNHPHGNAQPSASDAVLVQSLAYAADAMDLTMEDAYILSATGEVYSFAPATRDKLRVLP